MIRSMTAFANAESETPWGRLACELRSVNHRYLEITPRLPEELRALEPVLRERVQAQLARGKVDIVLRFQPSGAAVELRLNDPLLDQLERAARVLGERFPKLVTDFSGLLAFPGVLRQDEFDREGLQRAAMTLLDRALAELLATREREGERLVGAMRERLATIAQIVANLRARQPEIRAALRARLDARLAELAQPAEPGRLEQELVLQLSRIDVDEELDRLAAHIAEAERVLTLPEAIGRRLDFLMQEFNREANTLGAKSADPRTTQAAVELKVLIEQLREQVQNIE